MPIFMLVLMTILHYSTLAAGFPGWLWIIVGFFAAVQLILNIFNNG